MTDCDRLLLRRICRLMARTGRGDTHQACPLLKVNRPCHLAAVTSQFDPQPTWGKLKFRIATALCYPLRREAREEQGSETARVIPIIFSPVKSALLASKVSGTRSPRHFAFWFVPLIRFSLHT